MTLWLLCNRPHIGCKGDNAGDIAGICFLIGWLFTGVLCVWPGEDMTLWLELKLFSKIGDCPCIFPITPGIGNLGGTGGGV